jgi:hypothetical protein
MQQPLWNNTAEFFSKLFAASIASKEDSTNESASQRQFSRYLWPGWASPHLFAEGKVGDRRQELGPRQAWNSPDTAGWARVR